MIYFILGFISIFIFLYQLATPWLLDTSGAQQQVRSHRLRGGGGSPFHRAGGRARSGRGSSRRGTRRRRTSSWSRSGVWTRSGPRVDAARDAAERIGDGSGRQLHCRDIHGPDCEAVICIVNYNCRLSCGRESGSASTNSLVCGVRPSQPLSSNPKAGACVYVSGSETDTSVYISGSPDYGPQRSKRQNASGFGSLITSTPLKPRNFKYFERKLRSLPEVQEHELSTSTTD